MIKIGDIFSIEVLNGRAYFQYASKIKPMGSLIRVIPGVLFEPPTDWCAFIGRHTNFWVFFSVADALKNGVVQKEYHCPLPEHAQEMPLFRNGNVDPETKKVDDWWLWDGQKSWMVGALTDDQRRLPILGAWNDVMLRERIAQGWLPERDPR
jgi:hypothetical protein